MHAILMSAFGSFLGFMVRSVVVKFAVFTALFFVTSEFIAYLGGKLPDASSINGTLGSLTPGMWFFLDFFGFSYGFPLVLAAWAMRFIIRRLPVIG
jgi:hypothetical protein